MYCFCVYIACQRLKLKLISVIFYYCIGLWVYLILLCHCTETLHAKWCHWKLETEFKLIKRERETNRERDRVRARACARESARSGQSGMSRWVPSPHPSAERTFAPPIFFQNSHRYQWTFRLNAHLAAYLRLSLQGVEKSRDLFSTLDSQHRPIVLRISLTKCTASPAFSRNTVFSHPTSFSDLLGRRIM